MDGALFLYIDIRYLTQNSERREESVSLQTKTQVLHKNNYLIPYV